MSEAQFQAFFRGAARVVDIFGLLDKEYPFIRDDSKALEKDWVKVGSSIQEAIDEYGDERQPA